MKREVDVHKGCPNRGHCRKDESKCCYLLSTNTCYLDCSDSEEFV